MSKLIMINDNPTERMVMQKMFYRHELFHDAADTTDEQPVFNFLKGNCPNTAKFRRLIFLELLIPLCGGFDFMKQFVRLWMSFNKSVSIYIISSSIDENDRQRVLAYPFVRELKDKLQQIYATCFKTNWKAG